MTNEIMERPNLRDKTVFINQNMDKNCVLYWGGPEDGRLYNQLIGTLRKIVGRTAWELQDKHVRRLFYRFDPVDIEEAYLSAGGDLVIYLRGETNGAKNQKTH